MRTIIALICLFVFSGCSWMTSFVIRNNSDKPISIEYSLCCKGFRFNYIAPRIVSPEDLGTRGLNWRNVQEAEHLYNEKTGSVSLEIPQNRAVYITQARNYDGIEKNMEPSLNILELKISFQYGHISYGGIELEKAFKKQSRNLYVLNYK